MTLFPHSKVMFEIYRESGYERRYLAVFFTELDDHNRDEEINRALAGEHFVDGFLRESDLPDAKRLIQEILQRLNAGDTVTVDEVEVALERYST